MVTITRTSRIRKAAAATSVLAVAGAITLAAYSDWAEMETEFTTGTFGITLDGHEGNPEAYQVAFDASDLNPGDTAQTVVDLQNSGTITADVSLAATTATTESAADEAFLDALVGSYSLDGGESWSPEVALQELTTDADILLQGGESIPFAIRVHYEEGAGNAAQDGTVGVNFRFEAEQSVGAAIPGPEGGAVGLAPEYGVTYFLGADLHEQGAYGGDLWVPWGWEDLLVDMDADEAIYDPLHLLTDAFYPEFYPDYDPENLFGFAHADAPYRFAFDGSEQELPGLRQVGGTDSAPIFAWTPEVGEWVVTFSIELLDSHGHVVETTSHTNTLRGVEGQPPLDDGDN